MTKDEDFSPFFTSPFTPDHAQSEQSYRSKMPAHKEDQFKCVLRNENIARAAPLHSVGKWFKTNLLLLRITGFWYYGSADSGCLINSLQALYMLSIVTCNFMFFIAKAMHTALESESLRALTENVVDILCITFSLSQLIVLLSRKEHVQKVSQKIEYVLSRVFRDSDETCRKMMLEKQATSRTSSVMTFFLFLGTGLNFAIIVSVTGNKKHTLPVPIWTPFSQNESPTLEFLLLIESMGVILTVAGAGALAAFSSSCVQAVLASLKVVQFTFKTQGEQTPIASHTWSEVEKFHVMLKLKRGIQMHQTVLDLADETCQTLEPFYSCQIATMVFMICVALFQVSMNPTDPRNLRFVVLLLNILTQSFVICLQGTNLQDETSAVQAEIQAGDWCMQGKNIGSAAQFVTMRAQKPPIIRVGLNYIVGLPMFVEMMRSSYSIFAFLQKKAGSEQ